VKSLVVLRSSVILAALSSAVGATACERNPPTDPEPQGVRIVDYPRVMQVGDSFQLSIKVTGIDNPAVYYSPLVGDSPGASVVGQVSETGLVVANSIGHFTIIVRSAMYGEKIDTAGITVDPPSRDRRLQFKSFMSNSRQTCGISIIGDTYCWGSNLKDLLGVPARSICVGAVRPPTTRSCNTLPEKLTGGRQFVLLGETGNALTDSGNVCALTQQGDAFCWGSNSYGQLGNGTTTRSTTPIAIPGLRFSSLSVNAARTCGITLAGELYCWGLINPPFGSEYPASRCFKEDKCRVSPVSIAREVKFKSISLGAEHACAVADDDEAYCWGDNSYGELGDSTTSARSDPAPVSGGLRFRSVTAGTAISCGVSLNGDGYCWGADENQQLGTSASVQKDCNPFPLGSGPYLCARTPVKIAIAEPLSEIRVLRSGTCALSTAGHIFCWGLIGQTSAITATPARIDNSSYKSLVGAGDLCALDSQGFAYCWGYGFNGRFGNGFIGYSGVPTPVEGPRSP